MSDFPNARDCKHGLLARSCDACELEQAYIELDELKKRNFYQDVKAFHEKFGAYVGKRPSFPPANVMKLRRDLILEEFKELTDALKAEDIVGVADALCDLIYVLAGTGVALGIPLDKAWDEVQKSNMLKEGGATREDGKILKPAGWVPPDIEGAIFNCRVCRDKGYTVEVSHGYVPDHTPACSGEGCHPECPIPVPTTDVETVQCPCGQTGV